MSKPIIVGVIMGSVAFVIVVAAIIIFVLVGLYAEYENERYNLELVNERDNLELVEA